MVAPLMATNTNWPQKDMSVLRAGIVANKHTAIVPVKMALYVESVRFLKTITFIWAAIILIYPREIEPHLNAPSSAYFLK